MSKEYDVVVIGAGPGGSSCVEMLNEAGLHVALVEKDALGGECLNYGCDPSKTMLHIAQLLTHAQQAASYGASVTVERVDWAAVQQRIRQVLRDMRGGTVEEAAVAMRKRGIDLIFAEAVFRSPHELQVGETTIRGDQIVIATGADSVIPTIPGLDQVDYLTNRDVLYLDDLPKRMAIIGGGPIGVEFAQMFRRFGVDILLVEESDHLLPKDDPDVANALAEVLVAEGVDVRCDTKLIQVAQQAGMKQLTLEGPNGTTTELCDNFVLAVGRKPAIDGLALATAGVEVENGAIVVDETMRTSVEHIWSIGDVTGGYPFTHVANAQGRHVAQSIIRGHHSAFNRQATPWVTYTSPEVAHVGKTEAQLQKDGIRYTVGTFSFADVARAKTTGNQAGLIKLLVGEEQRILGCHICGEGAGDLIGPAVLAMRQGLPLSALQDIILPYPTMVEALQRAALTIASAE